MIGANLLPGIFRYFVAQKADLQMFAKAHARTYHRNSNELLNVLATTFMLKNIIGGGWIVFWLIITPTQKYGRVGMFFLVNSVY